MGMKQQSKCTDRDAWCTVALREKMPALKAMLQIALGFLLTETECEGSFAQERIQFSGGRGRLDPPYSGEWPQGDDRWLAPRTVEIIYSILDILPGPLRIGTRYPNSGQSEEA